MDPTRQETEFGNAVADLFIRGWQFPSLFPTRYPADAAAHTPGPARCPTTHGPFLLLKHFLYNPCLLIGHFLKTIQ